MLYNFQIRILLKQTFSRCRESIFDHHLPNHVSAQRSNTFQMSEYHRRQGETCVTQIPECTPFAPAFVSNDPKLLTSPIIKDATDTT